MAYQPVCGYFKTRDGELHLLYIYIYVFVYFLTIFLPVFLSYQVFTI